MKIVHSLIAIGTAAAASKLARSLGSLDLEDVLGSVGLSRRRSHGLENIALLGIGAAVGAGAALLLTPKNGKEMRETVRKEVERLGEAAKEALKQDDEPSRLPMSNARRTASEVSKQS